MKTLTVFTPTYNRAHTLVRTYESLCRQTCKDFEWLVIDDGSVDNTKELVASWILENKIPIRYVYKENGGLHTGYNTAIELMCTEICVCIDSDDYMPDDGVQTIINFWKKNRSDKIAGFIGLDYYEGKNEPIGGSIEEVKEAIHLAELKTKLHHYGDTKMVLRVDLLKEVAPQPSFPGEKNFNPIYMILLIDQKYQFLTINKNLCFVDYQENGMAANIFKQYVNSPRSFAALRLVELQQPKLSYLRYLMLVLHYVADKFLANEVHSIWKENAPKFWISILFIPGWVLSKYIKYKANV